MQTAKRITNSSVITRNIKVLTLAVAGAFSCSSSADDVLAVEKKLLLGLESIQTLSMDNALDSFSALGEQHPNYKLAQLMKADLLALKAGQKPLLDQVRKNYPKSVARLKDEAAVRWQFAQSSASGVNGYFDNYVLKTAQQSHLIFVNLSESRLYLYERDSEGQMTLVTDYYVTMGRKGSGKQKEGDLRTPIGVYHIVDLLPGAGLPDLYGVGALPLNYPNDWDSEQGKTGSGIWLHGTPSNTYIRAPKASRGCVVLHNKAMDRLLSEYSLPYATPVLIVDDAEQLLASSTVKESVLTEVKTWLDNHHIGIDWTSVSVYRYPNEEDLLYVTFPAAVENELIHQYWKRGDNGWKLVIQSKEPVRVEKKA